MWITLKIFYVINKFIFADSFRIIFKIRLILNLIRCGHLYGGCHLTFSKEVFETRLIIFSLVECVFWYVGLAAMIFKSRVLYLNITLVWTRLLLDKLFFLRWHDWLCIRFLLIICISVIFGFLPSGTLPTMHRCLIFIDLEIDYVNEALGDVGGIWVGASLSWRRFWQFAAPRLRTTIVSHGF